MKPIYLATNNPKKRLRFEHFFKKRNIKLEDAQKLGGMPYVEETENSYIGNARLKAVALAKKCLEPAFILSDDSGLELEVLGGRPGVNSAYFGGPEACKYKNNSKLLAELKDIPYENRKARFVCCLFLLDTKNMQECAFYGHLYGRIKEDYNPDYKPDFFGYQPLFVPNGHEKSLEELSLDAAVHRIEAIDKLFKWIETRN